MFVDGTVYADGERFSHMDSFPLDEAARQYIKEIRTDYQRGVEKKLAQIGGVCRINIFYGDERSKLASWEAIDAEASLCRTSLLPCNIGFTDIEENKGAALRWLFAYLDADTLDVAAFGGGNDEQMLETAGVVVSVGNALEYVKAAADHVTTSCDESGVAVYPEPIFFEDAER